jgi:hypothetical protein
VAEADGEGVGEEDGGDDGSLAGCSAERVWAPFGRVGVEMPIWRKRPFPADTLALPNSQPFIDIDDGRALETEFSEFGWLQQRGDYATFKFQPLPLRHRQSG